MKHLLIYLLLSTSIFGAYISKFEELVNSVNKTEIISKHQEYDLIIFSEKDHNLTALYQLFRYHRYNNLDNNTASKWLIKIANILQEPEVYHYIGSFFAYNFYDYEPVQEKYNIAIHWYKKALLLRKDGSTYSAIGQVYVRMGLHDDPKTLEAFTQAALLDDLYAQSWLGDYFLRVDDCTNAIKWISIAAEREAKSKSTLSNMYRYGKCVLKNPKKAFELMQDAAQDYLYAKTHLGDMYYFGEGTNINYEKARLFYLQNDIHAHSKAKAINMLVKGQGGKQDLHKAATLAKEIDDTLHCSTSVMEECKIVKAAWEKYKLWEYLDNY